MRQPLIILVGVLAMASAVFAGSFFACRQICHAHMANTSDDLAWLGSEFNLDAPTMARIRQFHEGYLPKCAAMCERIAAKKSEIEAALENPTNLSSVVPQKLIELGELRAQCQSQMLEHFVEVSSTMPTEQGRRYLAEMQRLTLGLHQQMEESMTDHAGHQQPHHHE